MVNFGDDDDNDDDELILRMADRRKAFSFIFSPDFCQRFSPSQVSDTPQAGVEPALNQISGFVE